MDPEFLLDFLSKSIQYSLNRYPMLAIEREKIEFLCDRFKLLFNGDLSMVGFHSALLQRCIIQYCECILIFVQDNFVNMKTNEVDYHKRWLGVLDNLAGVGSIKNKFLFIVPVLQNSIYENLPPWIKKEFMIHFNRVFKIPMQLIFSQTEKATFLHIVESWLNLIMTSGDYEFQTILVEAIISTCELRHFQELLIRNFGEIHFLTSLFLEVYYRENYLNDLKIFLNALNDYFGRVRSVPCVKVTLEVTVIPPLKSTNGDDTWMYINYGFCTLSFECQQDSLKGSLDSINHSDAYEFITVNFDDIDQVYLLLNNDSKTLNSIGGTVVINLTGKCLCRFDSSKEIVSSITKITLVVPQGAHLKYLKEAFIKLFGRRFMETDTIPIKKRNFYDKRSTLFNSSTPSSSYQADGRRKRHNDSSTSQGSHFLKYLKLENSLTVKNKKTTNSQLLTTPTTRLATKSTNNKENETADRNITLSSRDPLLTEKYLSAKNDCLMSPNTSKNNLSLLKSRNIDTPTTWKNKEMPGSSKISHVVADTEGMTIPNKSSTLKNDELNSIPDLRSPKAKISSNAKNQAKSLMPSQFLSEDLYDEESGSLVVTVWLLNSAEEVENFQNGEWLQEMEDNSGTLDIDSTLAHSTKNIPSPYKSTNEKNLDEEVIVISDDDQTIVDEFNGDNEDTNEEMRSIISISSMEEIDSDVSTEINPSASTEIDSEASTEINPSASTEIDSEASTEIDSDVSTEINSEASTEINPSASTEIDSEASTEINPSASTEINPSASTEIDSEASTEIDSDVSTEINSEASTEINPSALTEIDSDVSTEIDSDVSTEIDCDASTEINSEASTEINPSASTEINPSASTEIDSEASTEIDSDVSTEINSEASTEINPSASTEINPSASTEIDSDVSTEIDSDVSTEIDCDASTEIDSDASTEILVDDNIMHCLAEKTAMAAKYYDDLITNDHCCSADVPLLLNEIDDREIAGTISNDNVGLIGRNQEVTGLRAEVALKMQEIEALQHVHKHSDSIQTAKPNEICRTTSTTSEREHITTQSEKSQGDFQRNFEKFIESSHNRLPNNDFLMDQNKSRFSEDEIIEISDEESNKSTEIDFEMLIPRNQLKIDRK